ncbi:MULTISPECIES: DUF2007 domain-containing protein [Oceanimonas]|uniref:RanBP2-type domain-containing protein n=1 Tax=Oceanimonas doudoroffii TaxID=84158 RepID=A0A233RDA7_9GAMM|nr:MULTISPECIES: DUF2007 domain-containing protein [Oceanimonas]NHH99371.1 hypothetical protein [Oceanimonas sp. MB9]OXY81387.1 hypothetical protein B6S08_12930 [Oceanimonas doudoroffii]
MNDWIPVYQAAHSLEAHTLKGALESRGMAVKLQGEALAGALGELPMDVAQVTLLVQEKDWQRARTFLQDYQRKSQGTWHCGSCGEENDASFEICWRCGSGPEGPEQ